jgi:hypothetical protein
VPLFRLEVEPFEADDIDAAMENVVVGLVAGPIGVDRPAHTLMVALRSGGDWQNHTAARVVATSPA